MAKRTTKIKTVVVKKTDWVGVLVVVALFTWLSVGILFSGRLLGRAETQKQVIEANINVQRAFDSAFSFGLKVGHEAGYADGYRAATHRRTLRNKVR